MPALVSFGDTEILSAVRSVLVGLLPPGIEVIRAFGNRVPEPVGLDFCVLIPLRRERLSTNRDRDFDLKVTASISSDTMLVEDGFTLLPGYPLYGPAVAPGSVITAAGADPNTYTVAPPQSVPTGSTVYVGRHAMLQAVDVVHQCDVHGPNSNSNAFAIATTWRDDAGCQLLNAASGPLGMQPLYAGDPRLVPFTNAEDQWEDRWIVELHTQANIIVSLGQEFAETLQIDGGLIPADLFYPIFASDHARISGSGVVQAGATVRP
jgi:hypothetical protein